MRQLKDVKLSKIVENPEFLRPVDKDDPNYLDLVMTAKQDGIINPVVIRPTEKNGSYELVTGVRRWHAAQDAGLETIPAVIMDLTDEEVAKLQIIEAAHQSPVRRSEFSAALLKLLDINPNLTVAALAKKLSKSTSWVYTQLGLNKLIPHAKELVDRGEISLSNAYALSRLPELEQEDFLDKAMTMTNEEFAPLVAVRMKDLKAAKPMRSK